MLRRFLITVRVWPSARSPAASGPLHDFLRDPAGSWHTLLNHLGNTMTTWAPTAATGLAAGAVLLRLGRAWQQHQAHQRLARGAQLITVLPPPDASPDGASALWAHLTGLLRPARHHLLLPGPHLSWEYLLDRDAVRIRLWVPGSTPPDTVERAVEAAWPGARTRARPAAPPHPTAAPSGYRRYAAGGELRLARSDALPLRTDFTTDPLRALLGAPTGLSDGEEAVVQVLARPATGRRVARTRRAARHLQAGHATHPLGRLLDALTPAQPSRPRPRPAGAALDHQTALAASVQDRAITAKLRGPLYETCLRYILTASVPAAVGAEERRQVQARLHVQARALAAAFAIFTEHNHYHSIRSHRLLPRLTQRRLTRGQLLSTPELAAVAHLPWDVAAPGLERAPAKAVPPPPGTPATGEGIKLLGVSDTGPPRSVGLHVTDTRHHIHILGATGAGKSELIARLALSDADAGRGLLVIDPKGDLVTDLLPRLPAHRAATTILFDADSLAPPPVLNPLDHREAARSVDHVVSVFARIYAASWGPRTDDILRAALLTLHAQPGTPLLTDLPRLLADPAFRRRATAQVRDPVLRGFWAWYGQLSDPARAQITAPLLNKLRGLLLRPFVRAVLADGPSTVSMDTVLDGGICLVRIPQSTLGADTAHLIGSLTVAAAWQAATRRTRHPPGQRPDAALYLDEAHHFLHLPYPLEMLLAEARGYHLSLTLAHQYLSQLPHDLEEAISTNARTKVFFNVSPEDAHHLARHTLPRLNEYDLSHLGRFQAVVRPVLYGAEAPAFTLRTEPLPPPRSDHARISTVRPAPCPRPVVLAKDQDVVPADPRRAP
ncbi:type IV secretory system conjugative DNA transfer family protein [Streptomyces paromomycinus]|uniref:Conjugal transfer protein TraG n=1 Tax=Streptomyces paromomycinus TaxID=92743 RepID=A0A401VUS1_STREY|nr:DUF87 domain-containing protein [Streptomyces paromomycinus]GCD40806.1 conjugal transfer protein TraG [Streptomyces paromomycinus]